MYLLIVKFTGSSKVLDKKPKITTLKSAASSGKNESKPKLIVNLSTSQSSRKVVSADEIVQPEKTAYADEIIITSAKKKDSNLSLFINGKKRTVDMRKYKFDDEKLKSWDSQKSVKFKVNWTVCCFVADEISYFFSANRHC